MTKSPIRNALIAAGIAATLGIGVAGCDNATDDRASDAPTRTSSTANSTTDNTREANRATDNTRLATGDTRQATGSTRQPTGDTRQASGDTRNDMRNAGDNAAQATSDTWITTKVKSVLLADSEASGLDIEVDTKDGIVTLEGELTSQAAVDHVKALAQDVEGVKRVNFSALTVARR